MVDFCDVLVVHDDPGMCTALRDLLAEDGYVCRTARDGAEALKLLETVRTSVILIGLEGQKMSETAFEEGVRARIDWSAVKIIEMTDGAPTHARHLHRPFTAEELERVIVPHVRRPAARFAALARV